MHFYKHVCKSCGRHFKQMTRHQYHCIQCLHKNGPDLVVNVDTFHAELYTELIPYKRLNKFFTAVGRLSKQKKGNR